MKQRISLITGASSGIGEALSLALASRGSHVVLVARSVDKLERLAQTIRQSGGAATVLPADLSQPGAAQGLFDEVQRRGWVVELLVNNAGFGYYGPFEGEPIDELGHQLQVNVVALAELTRLFVPSLLELRGKVLNIASTAAFQPVPYMSVYAATKAFVLSFSEALWAEYRGRGLHVAAVCPGWVETPFVDAMGSNVRQSTTFRSPLTVDQVVRACLSALESPEPSRVVGWRNWLMAQSSRFSPRALTVRIGAQLMRPR